MTIQSERHRHALNEPVNPPANSVILDLGTTTLRLLSAELAPGQATVWGWAQEPMPASGEFDPQHSVPLLEELLNRAESAAEIQSGQRAAASQLVVGLPASQLHGWSWSVSQRRAQPERPVEERELGALLGRARRLAVSRLQAGAGTAAARGDSAAKGRRPSSTWVPVDQVCVALSVDDRGVTDPVGFAGERIGAVVFAALASRATIEAWRAVASRLRFSTLLLVAAPIAQVLGLPDPEGLLIDVGGATTDLVLWRAGRPVALQSVAVGGEHLTHPLIQAWGLSPARAQELKCAYASGQLSKEAKSQILQVMLPALRVWFDETEQSLSRFCELGPLPHRLCLSGGGSTLPEMIEAARALIWSEHLAFTRYPEISRLLPMSIPHVLNRTDRGREAGDTTVLSLAAWAAEQLKPPERPARVLNSMCEAERFS